MMETDKLIKDLRRNGVGNGTSLGHHSGLCDIAADCIEELTVQLAEKDKQLVAAVEDLRGLCWCCANGKKWDKAPVWSNMTTCEHIRGRGSLAVGGGKAGKDCPHWKWRGPQEAGEVEYD